MPDLTVCDREPITRLDLIQPFGFLLALSDNWTIVRASANAAEFVGTPTKKLIGTDFGLLLTPIARHDIRNALTMVQFSVSERLFNVALFGAGQTFDLCLHRSGDLLVIEAEPSQSEDRMMSAATVRAMIGRLARTESPEDFQRDAARQVRALTGFDRVMIYRFDETGAGEVIAEACRSGVDSYLGLHFPASDIPVQARALYLLNSFRIIADVEAQPVRLAGKAAEPLDLSLSTLRAVSPVHLEYLRNMGVAASLSISIVVDGALWGLIACHHQSPRLPGFVARTAAELFGAMYSLCLESRLNRSHIEDTRQAFLAAERLASVLATDDTMYDDADRMFDLLSSVIPADGLAITRGPRLQTCGAVPPAALITDLVALSRQQTGSFDCDCLAEADARCAGHSTVAAGMLAVPIGTDDCLMLFRGEQMRERTWGGDPAKAMVPSEEGLRLSPRKSFEAYVQQVSGRCRPWSSVDRLNAEAIRIAMIEISLKLAQSMSDERRRSNERQDLLIAELNHRVRNILTLIRGLIGRSGTSATDIQSYVAALGGRVQSLARAHDQLTAKAWRPSSLRQLIHNELQAHDNHVVVEGTDALLRPEAVPTLALVVHELATNSAKYGAIGAAASVTLTISREDGGVAVAWVERGGPPVRAPERRGFGSVLIERAIPFELKGKAEVRYALAGFEAYFFIPEAFVAGGAIQPESFVPPDRAGATRETGNLLDGRQVLVLEDNMLIAIEIEDMLRSLGATNVVMTSNVRDAQAAIAGTAIDAAVLDIGLRGENSFLFASQLERQNVPFIFASGYGEQVVLDANHSTAIVIQKPFEIDHLARALEAVLDPATQSERPVE